MNIIRRKLFRKTAIAGSLIIGGSFILQKRMGSDQEASMATLDSSQSLTKGDMPMNFAYMNQKRGGLVYKTRSQHLKEAEANPNYDVVIIGGGCTGAGVALNTAAAGLRTLLIDAYDFGTGTSSKSTKLLHGGYRYFQKVFELSFNIKEKKENFGLVVESVQERDVVINNAPHINRYVGLCVPCRNIIMAGYFYVGANSPRLVYGCTIT